MERIDFHTKSKRLIMAQIQRILIANRGEIARRIIRACRKLGISSMAVYSEADREAPHVQEADLAVCIGNSPAQDSYLHQEKLIQTALEYGADAIHPGYGFLAENAAFAQKVLDAGLIFIGPHPEAIEVMGSKSRAKAIMESHGVPVIPGYRGEDQSLQKLHAEAGRIGFPILLKAAAGGGGKGMRIVYDLSELDAAIQGAQREAQAAFGDAELLIEKYFPAARHVEFQIFGDRHGNALHLLERECSIQRRYQKIMEESPSPVLTPELREAMGQAAVRAAQAIRYDNAGTVEFIFVEPGAFYFLEVNTRLQVEHPVTEAITGLDLVEWQIRVAEGQALPWKQETIAAHGYALECRLYAEDAAHEFLPATGKVLHWQTPALEGLRYDSGVESGTEIGIYYDPMIAKIIAHGPNRQETIRRMRYALGQLYCLGLTTNQQFLIRLLQHSDIQAGRYNTGFLADHPELQKAALPASRLLHHALIACTLFRWQDRREQQQRFRHLPSGWRNNFYQMQEENLKTGGETFSIRYRAEGNRFSFFIGEQSFQTEWISGSSNTIVLAVDGCRMAFTLVQQGEHLYIHIPGYGSLEVAILPRFPESQGAGDNGTYSSPMPGEVIDVLVCEGQAVEPGAPLVILSSMKMEHTISAAAAGIVEAVLVKKGDKLAAGAHVAHIAEA